MCLGLLLLLAVLDVAMGAATLDQVRVFSGKGHARLLIVTEGSPSRLQARSSPAVGSAPARGVVLLSDTGPGPDGARVIQLDEDGITRISIESVGEALQLTVELEQARVVHVRALGEGAVLVDLQREDQPPDPSLPDGDQLKAWVEGVSLVRAAGGPPRTRRLVVVDPGHGGFDHGAVGLTGTREADVALQIALRTAAGLREELGAEVLLTRETDVFIPLRERAALANHHDADLFLSIHANAAPGPTAWGIETYSLDTASDAGAARVASRENTLARVHADEDGPDPLLGKLLSTGTNRLSRELSGEVQRRVVDDLRQAYGEGQIRDLGSKTALFYVLVSTRMPAILFEASFLTHPEEERRLRTPQFHQATADALVDAVGAWFERQGEPGEGR